MRWIDRFLDPANRIACFSTTACTAILVGILGAMYDWSEQTVAVVILALAVTAPVWMPLKEPRHD